jgi:hypothetical protein
MGRCPVQSSTPLGPDQVNVIIIIILLERLSQADALFEFLSVPKYLKN